MNIEKLKNLVEYRIIAHEEDCLIEGNASCSDEETDKEIAKRIYKELGSGNIWAWCCVQVQAVYNNNFIGEDFLGCCSYDNEKDFIENSGYYEDMKACAFDCLVDCIEAAQKQFDEIS
jgi:hypothetical protein